MTPRKHTLRLIAASLLLMPAIGCGYGEVGEAGYEYSKALYAITNRQAADRLAEVAVRIEGAVAADELSSREAAWLQDIVEKAESGDWKEANRECRELMNAQVKR